MTMYVRKIRCPRHHILKPGKLAFQIEPNPFTVDTKMSDEMCRKFGIRKWKYKRDRFGNKIPDYKNHYQPQISAAFALERIFDQHNLVCQKCKKCLEGFGRVALIQTSREVDGRTLKNVTDEMLKQANKEGLK